MTIVFYPCILEVSSRKGGAHTESYALLLRLGLAGVPALHFRTILTICQEAHGVQFGVYGKAAERLGTTYAAVQKSVSRYGPDVWERGLDLKLWQSSGSYESPRHLLEELLFLLSKPE